MRRRSNQQRNRRENCQCRTNSERRPGTKSIPEHSKPDRCWKCADPDREIIPAVGNTASRCRRNIRDECELCALGETEIQPVGCEEHSRVPRLRRATKQDINQRVDEPSSDERRSPADTIRQRAAWGIRDTLYAVEQRPENRRECDRDA